MSTLRTYNLQNPDSSNVNIELTQGSGAVVAGVATFSSNVTVSGNLTVGGELTYEDVTNIDSVGIVTARSDIYLGNDIYLTDGSSGYEKVEVDSNDIRVEQKHIHSEFGVWTRSTSVNDRRLGIDGAGNNLLLYANSAEKVRITDSGKVGIGTDNPQGKLVVSNGSAGLEFNPNSNQAIVSYNRVTSTYTPIGLQGSYQSFGIGGLGEVVRITSAGTLESYSPDDTTPNIRWRSDDTNWFGALNQSVHGGTITSFLSCGGDWSANGTTYSATKALAAYPTSAIAIHNQYNNTWGSEFVFLTKAGGSSTTDGAVTERLRITSGGKLEVYKGTAATGKTSGSEAFTVGNGANNKRFSVYPDGSTVIGGQGTIGNYNILLQNDGTIITTSGMQATGVNLQSSSTNSWFQTGASYGGTNYVWAAKDSSSNVWHSGLQTDGDLWLGGNITGTSNIKLDGSSGNATFIGKINVGASYAGGEIFALGKSSGTSYLAHYNGGTAHGFIGHADQLVSGGSATDFAIRSTNRLLFATDGNNERLRIDSNGELSISGARSGQNISDAILKFNIVNSNGDSKKAEIKSIKTADTSSELIFSTTSSHTFAERMRISSHGRIGINDHTGGWAEALQVSSLSSQGQYCLALKIQNNSGYFMRFTNGTNLCGSVSSSGGNSTSFNTSWSDSRRKKNFENWNEEVLPLFKTLEPKKFNFTHEDDGSEKTKGYVAQDVVNKFPEAYPLLDDTDVDDQRYMFNPSGMTVYLMKALQEEIAKREALEARIAALEG